MMIKRLLITGFLVLLCSLALSGNATAAPASMDIVSAWDKYYGLVYSGVPEGLKEGQVYEVWRDGERIGTFKFLQVDQSFSKGQFIPDDEELILKKKDKLKLVAPGTKPRVDAKKKQPRKQPGIDNSEKLSEDDGKDNKFAVRKATRKRKQERKKAHPKAAESKIQRERDERKLKKEKIEKKKVKKHKSTDTDTIEKEEEKTSFSLIEKKEVEEKKSTKVRKSRRYSSRVLTYHGEEQKDEQQEAEKEKDTAGKDVDADEPVASSRYGHITIKKISESAAASTEASEPEKKTEKEKQAKKQEAATEPVGEKEPRRIASAQKKQAEDSTRRKKKAERKSAGKEKSSDRTVQEPERKEKKKKKQRVKKETKKKAKRKEPVRKQQGASDRAEEEPRPAEKKTTQDDEYTEEVFITINRHIDAGNSYMVERKFHMALKHYSAVIAMDPDNVIARKNMILAMRKLDILPSDAAAKYEEWKEHQYQENMGKNFQKEFPAAEQVMDLTQMENNYGVYLVGQGRYEEGITWITKAINGNPKVGEYYRNRAVAYFYNGELYLAVDDAKKALDLGDPKARNLMLTLRDRIIAKGLEAQK